MVRITLACAPAPRLVFEQALSVPDGATVREAVRASALAQRFPALQWQALTPGIWGRVVPWERILRANDRVELCRALLVDPKTARRERFARQGARATGLFAQRRPGAKPGY